MKLDIYDPQLGIFVEHDVLVESEWLSDLGATEGLTDEEREAAAKVLQRMGRPRHFVGVDLACPGFTAANVRHMANTLSRTALAAASALRTFGVAATKLGRIVGQHHDMVIMDDWPTRLRADRLSTAAAGSVSGGYRAFIHPENLKHLVPAEPVFPPKVEGETVVPGMGRTCVDPRPAHVGAPIWRFGQPAPLPPDQMPEPRTFQGHYQKATQPPLRSTLARSAQGRHRKQRR